jgi:tetratricopeptide (TPR) repeat protein
MMRYDRDGFPIPPDFDAGLEAFSADPPPLRQPPTGEPTRRQAGTRKRWILFGLIAALLLPSIVIPEMMPAIRQMVVEWSLEQALAREAQDDIGGAIGAVGRAIRWHGDDVELLCMRSMLRLEHRDAAGALEDANRAASFAPTSPQPLRARSLAHVVLGDAEAALEDAQTVVEMSAAGDPEALNHRAYVRALVGRDLPAALEDIDAAIGGLTDATPELLDTRGFILHLLGRTEEAIDQLNQAIDGMQQNRRQLGLLAGRVDRTELARRLRVLDHGLAVMLHHRGLACAEAGLEEQANQDFEIARKKGFDPSRGIF